MLLKVWELSTQHCVQTLIGTRNEIWSIAKNPQETRLLIGSVDQDIRVWNLEPLLDSSSEKQLFERDLVYLGVVKRNDDTSRVYQIKFDPSGLLFAVHSDSKTVEVFRERTIEAQKKKYETIVKQNKKKKKDIEMYAKDHIPDEDEKLNETQEDSNKEPEINFAAIEYSHLCNVEASQKVRSFDFHPEVIKDTKKLGASFKLVVSTLRNSLEEFTIPFSKKEGQPSRTVQLARQGHSMPVRATCFSSDYSQLCTVSNKECKIWNVDTGSCIRSVTDCIGYGLCCKFLPGNKHVLVGTKQGDLHLIDVNHGDQVQHISNAHDGSIWNIVVKPDKRGVITGSSDKSVKFWDFQLIQDPQTGAQRLSLELEHVLKMNDDVISVLCSPGAKYLAVALMDSTIKIFYLDSLKFFLSLYGHKLPVNSMDISSDETLIVTASQDKNVKLWGLDYGDCHKSIFAHENSITSVQFVDGTHYFCTASKDGAIKYWDGDTYECIQILRPVCAHSPLWCLSVSQEPAHPGLRVAAAGHERNIIIFKQTDDQLFLEEEREKRMEQGYEQELLKSQQFKELQLPNSESGHAGKRTIETIRDAEQLMDALTLAMEEEKLKSQQPYTPNPLLLGMSIEDYVWATVKRVRASELDVILAILGFSHAMFLLRIMSVLLTRQVQVELATRIVLTLVRIHRASIVLDNSLYDMMQALSQLVKQRLYEAKNMLGFNQAALGFVKRRLQGEKELLNVDAAVSEEKKMKLAATAQKRFLNREVRKDLKAPEQQWKENYKRKLQEKREESERKYLKIYENKEDEAQWKKRAISLFLFLASMAHHS